MNFSSSVDLIPEGNVTTDDSNPSIDNILSILLKQFPDVFSDELGKKLMKVPPAKITLMGNEKDLPRPCSVAKSLPLFQHASAEITLKNALSSGIVERVPLNEPAPRVVSRAMFMENHDLFAHLFN